MKKRNNGNKQEAKQIMGKKHTFFFKTQKNRVCFLHISEVFFKDKKIYKMQELHHHIMLRVLTNYFKPYKAAYQRAP